MSLLATASIWSSDSPPKKRVPTMRKTVKRVPDTSAYVGDSLSNYDESPSQTLIDTQDSNTARNSRVHELIGKMASVSPDNEGNTLADFNPISAPSINFGPGFGPDSESDLPKTSNTGSTTESRNNSIQSSTHYSPSSTVDDSLSNYNKSYEPRASLRHTPYYVNGGGNDDMTKSSFTKVIEKINYMVHMMEEQQFEKTNNVIEEFILYTFLGIFVIFIVDSFSKIGKYTR
jgi:hypothetical protein